MKLHFQTSHNSGKRLNSKHHRGHKTYSHSTQEQ